jgi:serine/threonine protein kinase
VPTDSARPDETEADSRDNRRDTEKVRQLRPEPASQEFRTDQFSRVTDDDATELQPDEELTAIDTDTQGDTRSQTGKQTEKSGGSLYPGKLPNVRAPGWDRSTTRTRKDLEQRESQSPGSAPELEPASAPSLDSVHSPKHHNPRSPEAMEEISDRNTEARPDANRQHSAGAAARSDTGSLPARPGEQPRAHRKREDFHSVNEAAKELARAALQAEIEREEKRALQGYQAEEGEIPPSPEVAKRFDVILQLGKGGMAVVYLCRDPRSAGRVFAVKDIRAEMKPGMKVEERVEHEANLLKKLDHPGIVKVYDFLKFTRGSAIVMEYIDGLPLDHEIGAGRRITWDFGMRILREIGKALQYAHDYGVIHRDIKPDNILYSERHSVMKLVDFGLARIYGEEPDVHMTRTGMVVGTPHYMSPEQVSGKPLDQRSDVYSFGATLYYLLTGQRHVEGDNVMDILEQQRSKDILPPSHIQRDIPGWVSYIIGKMMEIKPDARYPDMNAVLRDLDAAEENPEMFLINPPLGPVKRYGQVDLAPYSAEFEDFGTGDSADVPSGITPERATSRISGKQRRTTHRTGEEPPPVALDAASQRQIAVMLEDISTRLERTERRIVSPGALVLIVMLSTLVIVLLIVGALLYASREGLLERLLYV